MCTFHATDLPPKVGPSVWPFPGLVQSRSFVHWAALLCIYVYVLFLQLTLWNLVYGSHYGPFTVINMKRTGRTLYLYNPFLLVNIFLWPYSCLFCIFHLYAISYFMFGIAAIFDCFRLYLAMDFDCTPVETITGLLLQSLQRIPDVAESRSRHLIPLFLNFMGYGDGSIIRYLYKISDFCTLDLNWEI